MFIMRRFPRFAAAGAIALLGALGALAQRGGFFEPPEYTGPPIPVRNAEFHFIRVEYTDLPQFHRGFGYSSRGGRGSGWWMMDWPDAENHFTSGLQRLTRIDAADPRHFRLTDPRLFDHPWIYATQTAWWGLSDAESARLAEYLHRGGFLVVDDFFGDEDWELFRRTMDRVLPGRPIIDIPDEDAVMHVLYDIHREDRVFIPGSRHLRRGRDGQAQITPPQGTQAAWRGIYDDRGRLLVAVNFNSDVADAWEFADAPFYPEKLTALAYRFGINYVVYAMSH